LPARFVVLLSGTSFNSSMVLVTARQVKSHAPPLPAGATHSSVVGENAANDVATQKKAMAAENMMRFKWRFLENLELLMRHSCPSLRGIQAFVH
jgi:hypothetical protein